MREVSMGVKGFAVVDCREGGVVDGDPVVRSSVYSKPGGRGFVDRRVMDSGLVDRRVVDMRLMDRGLWIGDWWMGLTRKLGSLFRRDES